MNQESDDRPAEYPCPDEGGPERSGRDLSSAERYGTPAPKLAASSSRMWAGVGIASAVVVALTAIAVMVIIRNNPEPMTAPAPLSGAPSHSRTPRTSRAPSTASAQSTAGPQQTAAPVGAGQFATFAREWRGMRESVVIDPAGHGHFHYMMACASCSMAQMPYNTMEFILTSVSGAQASGSVTASSDSENPVGEPVTATLAPHDTIQWALGGKNVGLFCGSDFSWCGG